MLKASRTTNFNCLYNSSRGGISGSTKWTKPPPGKLKINVDGAWREVDKVEGVGVVAARVRRFKHVFSSARIEASAAREGTAREGDSLQIATA